MLPENMTYKILESHLVSGDLIPGQEITIKVDQTLIPDSSGTMVMLELEAMNIDKVKTELSVAYMDHNLLQNGFENADDHLFIKSACQRFGVIYSGPGGGICHQNHIERFAKPLKTLVGADSHTPTSGALGMIAIGAGGLDVAIAMASGKYTFTCPEVVNVKLTGKLKPWVSAKDIGLEILRRYGVRGGYGKVLEYTGEGVKTLSVYERATIANTGTETGATSSIFPADERTQEFLRSHGRADDFAPLYPDEGAKYSEIWEINLDEVEPLVACPHSPGNVKKVSEIAGLKIDQVIVGSCTNSSYRDLMVVSKILEGRTIHPDISMAISPGSRRVLELLIQNGGLLNIISSGARLLEVGCGPCAGIGQAPPSKSVSLRTINRNFKGRCGTNDAEVYLVSPETAVVSALFGKLTDPRIMGEMFTIEEPDIFPLAENALIYPEKEKSNIELRKGPNITGFKLKAKVSDTVEGKVLLKLGNDISTDDICPSGSKIMSLRSNIDALSEYVFYKIRPGFAAYCREMGGGMILAGTNYGEGSSREHAALTPMALGIKAVLAISFARIHRSNLINFGILPIEITSSQYESIEQGHDIQIIDVLESLNTGKPFTVKDISNGKTFVCPNALTERERELIKFGGLLQYTKNKIS